MCLLAQAPREPPQQHPVKVVTALPDGCPGHSTDTGDALSKAAAPTQARLCQTQRGAQSQPKAGVCVCDRKLAQAVSATIHIPLGLGFCPLTSTQTAAVVSG